MKYDHIEQPLKELLTDNPSPSNKRDIIVLLTPAWQDMISYCLNKNYIYKHDERYEDLTSECYVRCIAMVDRMDRTLSFRRLYNYFNTSVRGFILDLLDEGRRENAILSEYFDVSNNKIMPEDCHSYVYSSVAYEGSNHVLDYSLDDTKLRNFIRTQGSLLVEFYKSIFGVNNETVRHSYEGSVLRAYKDSGRVVTAVQFFKKRFSGVFVDG